MTAPVWLRHWLAPLVVLITLLAVAGLVGSTGLLAPTPAFADAAGGATRIRDIQGATHISPYSGTMVANVPGIVTALRFSSGRGFYVQDPSPDNNLATSEAIFVFTGGNPTVSVGDSVVISGTVAEFRGAASNLSVTQITTPTVQVVSTGNELPGPTIVGLGGRVPPTEIIENDVEGGNVETNNVFDPAEDGLDFYESLEAMHVRVNEAVAVGPTNNFGEIPVVTDDGAYAGVRSINGGVVVRPNDFNPERLITDDVLVSAEPAVNTGAEFTNPITGVLDYSFGNYKLLNTSPMTPTASPIVPETARAAATDELSVATFNVENLDNNPDDDENAEEDAVKLAGLGQQLVNNLQSPDIVALQEVQDNNGSVNDGVVSGEATGAALIAAIEAAGGPTDYEYVEVAPLNNEEGGQPGGNIRVAFLYRAERVEFVQRGDADGDDATTVESGPGGAQLTLSPGRIDPTNPAFEGTRRVLVGEFFFNGQRVIVINNHWPSKGGDDPLFGRYQPPFQVTQVQRREIARVVNEFVDSIMAVDAEARVVLLGDLNDFEFSEPLAIVKGESMTDTEGTVLHNLVETLPISDRYSYVFDGNSQVLDHILVSGHLVSETVEYDRVHINADFEPRSRTSDHDPSLAYFRLPSAEAMFEQPNYTVSEDVTGGSATITVTLSTTADVTTTVGYETTGGTAAPDMDYVPVSGTLTFPPDTIIQTFTVDILDDEQDEPDETVTLELGEPVPPPPDLAGVGMQTAILTIVDNDEAPTAVTVGHVEAQPYRPFRWILGLAGVLALGAAGLLLAQKRRQ